MQDTVGHVTTERVLKWTNLNNQIWQTKRIFLGKTVANRFWSEWWPFPLSVSVPVRYPLFQWTMALHCPPGEQWLTIPRICHCYSFDISLPLLHLFICYPRLLFSTGFPSFLTSNFHRKLSSFLLFYFQIPGNNDFSSDSALQSWECNYSETPFKMFGVKPPSNRHFLITSRSSSQLDISRRGTRVPAQPQASSNVLIKNTNNKDRRTRPGYWPYDRIEGSTIFPPLKSLKPSSLHCFWTINFHQTDTFP